MSAAHNRLILGAALLGACGAEQQQQQQQPANNLAGAEVEALPADESSATPSDDLANGAADPQVNELEIGNR